MSALLPAEPEIVLDLSRLLSRVLHPTPTGVDRCEMAYARGLLARVPKRLRFGATHPIGFYGRLPRDAALRFLDATEARWAAGGIGSVWNQRHFAARTLGALSPRPVGPRAAAGRVYLLASPNNLTRPALVRAILRREQARFACLVHDLIPLQYPEYARPDGAALHARRIRTIVDHADGIITNSQATLDALREWLVPLRRTISTAVAHLGVDRRFGEATAASLPGLGVSRPYFMAISTIEPRKNHLLLLNIWRRMAEREGCDAIPKLVLVGRRGWENEQVVDMLERCPLLRGCVEERSGLPDRDVARLLSGARALLMPSFAEGYGMPVTEALATGVPVLCSDLPALREAGGGVPEFLDPLDGPAWMTMIERYLKPGSHARQQQLRRLDTWQRPTWADHLTKVLDLVTEIDL